MQNPNNPAVDQYNVDVLKAENERLREALKDAASAMEEVAYDLARVKRSNPLFVGRLRAYAKRARAALKEKP